MSEIRQQREIFLDQIRQIHVKINSHLDTLEHNILQELDNTGDKIRSNIDTLLKQLSMNETTTDPNVVIVDNISFNFVLMLELKLTCCRHASSDKVIMYSSSFFSSSSMTLLPRMVCRGDAYSLTAVMSLCNPSMVVQNYDEPTTKYVRNSTTKRDISRPD
jgi:hypothetical protein